LVRYFSERFCERERIPLPQFGREALALLVAHEYPGNVRELQNLVEAALSLADREVDAELLRSLMGAAAAQPGPEPLELDSVERRHIQRVLRLTGGNKSAAAKLLGLDRRTLMRKGF
jgi:DNA-binding NtrC family response regulator